MVSQEENVNEEGVKIVRTTSAFDCGGRCLLRFHMKDGKVIRVEGDDFPDPDNPVITTNLLRGIETSIFFRLCSRAPLIIILSNDMIRILDQ